MGQTASDGVVGCFLHQQRVQGRLNRRQAGAGGLSPACAMHHHCVALLCLLFGWEAASGLLSFLPAGAQ